MLLLGASAHADDSRLEYALKTLWEPALQSSLNARDWLAACVSAPGCAGDCQPILEDLGKRIGAGGERPICPRLRSLLGAGDSLAVRREKAAHWAREQVQALALTARQHSSAMRDIVDCTLSLVGHGLTEKAAACERADAREILMRLRTFEPPVSAHMIMMTCVTTVGCAPACRYVLGLRRADAETCPELAATQGETDAAWQARADVYARQHLADYVRRIAPLLERQEAGELKAQWTRLGLQGERVRADGR